MKSKKGDIVGVYNQMATERASWIQKNRYYYNKIVHYLENIIDKNASVMDIGCGNGFILNELDIQDSIGIDISSEMIRVAKEQYPEENVYVDDIEDLRHEYAKQDYFLAINVVGEFVNVPEAFYNVKMLSKRSSRMIIIYYNHLWEMILKMAERFKLKMKQPEQNWLSSADIANMLHLSGWELVNKNKMLLLPIHIPILSWFINRVLANIPFFKNLCFVNILVARPLEGAHQLKERGCSIVIPCKNEKHYIEEAVKRMPRMGTATEIIFVDDHSDDGTAEAMQRAAEAYPDQRIKIIRGPGICKAQAVWAGFEVASQDILMILDGDLTVMPEELTLFYKALVAGKADFINGCRLVYDMEKGAMRLLNMIGNKFFSSVFSFLLSQRIKDTLCGTKVFFKSDYERMKPLFGSFGSNDRWGDFNLLFSAAHLNLKIVDLPIHYVERRYGVTKMNRRFFNGLQMLRMSWVAAKKLKFRV